MATDHKRYADEIIPTSYASWRYCIEVKCGLPLSLDFVRGRIRILSDSSQEETERFARSHGQEHSEHVLAWFRQAADTLASGAGAKASGPRQTGP